MAQEDESSHSWLTRCIRTPIGQLVLVYLLLGCVIWFGYLYEFDSIQHMAVGVLLTLWFSRRIGQCCIPACALMRRQYQPQACSVEAMMPGLSWHCQSYCQHSMPVSPCRYCVGVCHPTADGDTTAAVHQLAMHLLAAALLPLLSAAAVATVTNLAVTAIARAAAAGCLAAAGGLAAAALLASTPGQSAIMIATTIAAFEAGVGFLLGLLQLVEAAGSRGLVPCRAGYSCSQTGMPQLCPPGLEKEGDTKVLAQASDDDDGRADHDPDMPLPQQAIVERQIEERQSDAETSSVEVWPKLPLPPVSNSARAQATSHSDGDVGRPVLHSSSTVQQSNVATEPCLQHTDPQPGPPGTRSHEITGYPYLDVSGRTAGPCRVSDSAEAASSCAITVTANTSACAVDSLETGAGAYASDRWGEPISHVARTGAGEWPSRESAWRAVSLDPEKEMPIGGTNATGLSSVPPTFDGGSLDNSLVATAETAAAVTASVNIPSATESGVAQACQPHEQHDGPSSSIEESAPEQDGDSDAKGSTLTTPVKESVSTDRDMPHEQQVTRSSIVVAETDHGQKKESPPQMPPGRAGGFSSDVTHSIVDQRLPIEPVPLQAMSATHQPVPASRPSQLRTPASGVGGDGSVSVEACCPDSAADSFSPKTEGADATLLSSAAGTWPANSAAGQCKPP